MHNNFYFLRQLSRELKSRLVGFTVVSCFSQSKDELVLEFNNEKSSFFIKASLQSDFCCLSFPDRFARARKNSVDLFPSVILKKVEGIRQYENERSFSIMLEGNFGLLFKMHGNRANIILLESNKPVGIFRNHLKGDWELNGKGLDRTIDWSKETFLARQDSLQKIYFTFGKEVWEYIHELGFEEADIEARWTILQQIIQQLNQPVYMICDKIDKLTFSLVPTGRVINRFSDPVQAINEFYYAAIQAGSLSKEKASAIRHLQAQFESGKQYIKKNLERLDKLAGRSYYQAWADLIMANMDRIKPGSDRITLENFYNHNLPEEIKLNKNLSPQKNAEAFYRKGKNQVIEIQKLKESIESKQKDIGSIPKKIESLEGESGLLELRKQINATGITKNAQKQNSTTLPYHEFEYKGFKIWIGKNAVSNDTLTLKYSFKEDLWLHAKDVAGSHVLLKYQSGKTFPKDVIEHAAQLAAYHSKRKNESLCPVAATPKKFVRKRKGDPAGAVVVEREEVILVTPSLKANG